MNLNVTIGRIVMPWKCDECGAKGPDIENAKHHCPAHIERESVVKVYFGKGGNKCRCGCNGKYYDNDNVATNKRMVSRAIALIATNAKDVELGDALGGEIYMDLQLDGRSITIYLKA